MIAEARAQCRVTNDDDDGVLAGYILAARQYAEGYTHRALIQQTWTATFGYGQYYDAYGCIRLDLPVQPLAAVQGIYYYDSAGAQQSLDPSLYTAYSGPDRIGYIKQAFNQTWPSIACVADAISVTYTAGYGLNPGDVPEPIRQAILLHVEALYDRDPQSRSTLESLRDDLLEPYVVRGF